MTLGASLHHFTRIAEGADPEEWILLLHGILGSGGNWASFARDLTRMRPEYGVLVPDHRLHGRSNDGNPPDDIESCVNDLRLFLEEFQEPCRAVIGHSFGSKIGVELAIRQSSIRQAFILDADPGQLSVEGKSRSDFQVLQLMDALRSAPVSFPGRDSFVEYMGTYGFRPEIAGWVGKNLKRCSAGLQLNLNLDRIETLLLNHHEYDLWPRLSHENVDTVDFIVGDRSKVVTAGVREKMHSLSMEHPSRHSLTVVPNAGHWLHVDQPSLLLEGILNRLF